MRIKPLAPFIITVFILAFTCHFIAIAAIDAPHNESNKISCGKCHGEGLLYSPFWGYDYVPAHIDDTPYNKICSSQCHTASSGPYTEQNAPLVQPHSDRSINGPGNEAWARECRVCHNPHYQRQKLFKSTDKNNLYIATGKIQSCWYGGVDPVTTRDISIFQYYSDPPITYKTETGWDAIKLTGKTDTWRGAILFPNEGKLGYSYLITAVDSVAETITVNGDLTEECGNNLFDSRTFAVMYGQYIKEAIDMSPDISGTYTAVKFFDKIGTNSFAFDESFDDPDDPEPNVDPTPDGVCQVCHTVEANPDNPTHWRADGTGTDHHNDNTYERGCIYCHSHLCGFGHGCGGGGTGCIECHGHDEGYEYSPGLFSQGKGTYISHSTHTEIDVNDDSDTSDDDAKGPFLACNACHDTNNYPKFYDGKDLSETDVCNPCHSPGGAFDGVDDPVIGAKNTWKYKEEEIWIQGVYQDNMLRAGKESWCTGCHDDAAPTIPPPPDPDGVTAKNVAGDNTAYGYFISGHGKYDISCTDCHDPQLVHIDDYDRTYAAASDNYTEGYRLKLVNGNTPMVIPNWGVYESSQFRLCYSCHDENAVIGISPLLTDFADVIGYSNKNLHEYHLINIAAMRYWDSDLSGEPFMPMDSAISCPTCHNPHGKDYDGRVTISMTRQDMGIVHKRDATGLYGYLENSDCDSPGGDLNCFGCHVYNSPDFTYYYQLGTPPPENPGFWTKLDSEPSDVTNPTYGTGGTFLGGTFTSYDRYGLAETGLSITGANQGCEFPASNINSNDEYYGETIDFWYVPNFNFSQNSTNRLLFDYYDPADPDNLIRIAVATITGGNSGIGFQIINGGANYLLITNPLSWTAGSAHHIVCTWGPAQGMHIYLDGEELSYYTSSGDYYGGINQTSSYFYVGRRYDGALHANGIIDDFKIYGYQYQKFESDLSLFSKMGSLSDIQNPIKGIGGVIGGLVSYAPGQQGLGTQFSSLSVGAVGFPTTNLNPDEDTIDLWYNPSFNIEDNLDSRKHLFWYNIDASNNAFIKVDADALNFTIIENGNSHTVKTTGLKNWGWYHIVCTWGPDGMYIYIDDKEASYSDDSGQSYTGGLPTTGMPTYFVIGNTGAIAGNYCEGIIDELRVYGYQANPPLPY